MSSFSLIDKLRGIRARIRIALSATPDENLPAIGDSDRLRSEEWFSEEVKRYLKGIGAGLKAVAGGMAETSVGKFRCGGVDLRCPVCGHEEFRRRSLQLNSAAAGLLNLEWLNKSACVLVCGNCRRMEVFAEAPSLRDET